MRHFSKEWWWLSVISTTDYLTFMLQQIIDKHFEKMSRNCTYLIPDNYSWESLFSHTFRSPLSYTIPPKEAMPGLSFHLTVILEVFSQCICMSENNHVYVLEDSNCACCLSGTTASIEIRNSGSCNRVMNCRCSAI